MSRERPPKYWRLLDRFEFWEGDLNHAWLQRSGGMSPGLTVSLSKQASIKAKLIRRGLYRARDFKLGVLFVHHFEDSLAYHAGYMNCRSARHYWYKFFKHSVTFNAVVRSWWIEMANGWMSRTDIQVIKASGQDLAKFASKGPSMFALVAACDDGHVTKASLNSVEPIDLSEPTGVSKTLEISACRRFIAGAINLINGDLRSCFTGSLYGPPRMLGDLEINVEDLNRVLQCLYHFKRQAENINFMKNHVLGRRVPALPLMRAPSIDGWAIVPIIDPTVRSEPEMLEPEVSEPALRGSEVSKPESSESEGSESEGSESEDSDSEGNDAECVELEGSEPNVSEPGLSNPEVHEPEVHEPEVSQPEVIQPEVIQPEVIQPEVIQPEVIQPEVIQPEVIQPEVIQPEVSELDKQQDFLQMARLEQVIVVSDEPVTAAEQQAILGRLEFDVNKYGPVSEQRTAEFLAFSSSRFTETDDDFDPRLKSFFEKAKSSNLSGFELYHTVTKTDRFAMPPTDRYMMAHYMTAAPKICWALGEEGAIAANPLHGWVMKTIMRLLGIDREVIEKVIDVDGSVKRQVIGSKRRRLE